jgi:hypothetical protein
MLNKLCNIVFSTNILEYKKMSEDKKKRGTLVGFDGIQGSKKTAKRMADWRKNQPTGRWRAIKQAKIRYTFVVQTWTYDSSHSHVIKHICPWGMVEFYKNIMMKDNNKRDFGVLPLEVKNSLSLEKDSFDIELLTVTCTDVGDKGYGNFYFLHCTHCPKTAKFAAFVGKHHALLPIDPTMETLMEHWDDIISADKSAAWYADFCGCILPNQEDVVVGPNGRRYIVRPCDHANKHHKEFFASAAASSSSSTVVSRKRPLDDTSDNNPLVKSAGMLRTKASCTKVGTTSSGLLNMF